MQLPLKIVLSANVLSITTRPDNYISILAVSFSIFCFKDTDIEKFPSKVSNIIKNDMLVCNFSNCLYFEHTAPLTYSLWMEISAGLI